MKTYKIELEIGEADFEATFGRKPKSQSELLKWFEYCEKGLKNGHIDWGIVFECAKDAM